MGIIIRTMSIALCLGGAVVAGGCGLVNSVDDALFRSRHEESYPNGKLKKAGGLYHGEQDGEWKYFYRNGTLRTSGTYLADKQTGRWTYWFKNGQKEMEGTFASQRRSGRWQYWHSGGEQRADGSFDGGRESGAWTFRGSGGAVERSGYFDRGRLALRWSYWHPGGEKRKAEGYYLDGIKVGRWRFWGESGGVAEKLFPLPEGSELVRETWPDGTPRREGFRKDGDPVGLWVAWHRNGEVRMVGAFKDGKADGLWSAHDGEGKVIATGPARAGRLWGDWMVWADDEERSWQPESVRPPGLSDSNWSKVTVLQEYDVEDAVEIWLGELTSPLSGAERVVPGGDSTPGASIPPKALLADVSEERQAPIRAQPFTVREEKEIPTYTKNYGTGATAGSRSSGRYGAATTAGRQPQGDTDRSQRLLGRRLPRTKFETGTGGTLDLADFEGKKNVVVVILRGFAGEVCVYCVTQTGALAESADKFNELGTEVVVLYPGPKQGLGAFLEAYEVTFTDEKPPYRILYDPGLELTRELGIAGELAIPSTLLLDASGTVRYAYVGSNIEDRPPAKDVLKAVRELGDS